MRLSLTIRPMRRRGRALVLVTRGSAPRAASAGEYAVADMPGGPAQLQHARVRRLRHARNEHQARVQPGGPGLRGLITSNVVRAGRVRRGARPMVAISAPHGHARSRASAGRAPRGDATAATRCSSTQRRPDIKPIAIKNVRANQPLPPPAARPDRRLPRAHVQRDGATRIVQRVICVGGRGSKSCSARGSNYIRTYKAEVGIADALAPAAASSRDTPLARGEWVSGTQPLNYDASDNVGVRMAHALRRGTDGGTQQRPCAFAAPEGPTPTASRARTAPVRSASTHSGFPDGTQPLVVQAQDTAGNVGDSPAVTARVDNTPPARVDVVVEGGEQWRNRNEYAAVVGQPGGARSCADRGRELQAVSGRRAARCTPRRAGGQRHCRAWRPGARAGRVEAVVWRRDAAGNESEDAASVPVTLRYDAEPPQLAFEPSPPARSDARRRCS